MKQHLQFLGVFLLALAIIFVGYSSYKASAQAVPPFQVNPLFSSAAIDQATGGAITAVLSSGLTSGLVSDVGTSTIVAPAPAPTYTELQYDMTVLYGRLDYISNQLADLQNKCGK